MAETPRNVSFCDRAIREAAAMLKGTFRASDVLGRLGGDEFCALLTGTGVAEEAIDRLRGAIDRRNA